MIAPAKADVQDVTGKILTHVGDQMGELWGALDDLLWDLYEPYQCLSEEDRAFWRSAVKAELNGGYEPTERVDA